MYLKYIMFTLLLKFIKFEEYKYNIEKIDLLTINDATLGKYFKLKLRCGENPISLNSIMQYFNIKERACYILIKELKKWDLIEKDGKNYILNLMYYLQ